ncbi:MAG TPA: hypothetical protein VF011_16515 [Terriglobales bacterium]
MAATQGSLRPAIDKLRSEIEWVKSGCGEAPHVALNHLVELNSFLANTAELLREARSAPSTPDAKTEISEYRDCLERLRDVLPLLQEQLLAQRSRLEPEREHVQAAAAWAQCARGMLK